MSTKILKVENSYPKHFIQNKLCIKKIGTLIEKYVSENNIIKITFKKSFIRDQNKFSKQLLNFS